MILDLNPRLLEAVRRARKTYRHLFASRIPLVKPIKRKLRDAEGRVTKKHVELTSVDILFRALSASEFDSYSNLAQYGDVTESIVRDAVLYPQTKKTWLKHPLQMTSPGHFEGLRDRIIEVSGYGDEQALKAGINIGRQESNDIYAVIETFICKAFPKYDPITVHNLPWLDQVKLLGAAEVLLGTEFPLKEILNPKPAEKTSKLPNFDELPVFSEQQLDEIRQGRRTDLIRDQLDRQTSYTQSPQDQRLEAVRQQRSEKQAIREAEAEAAQTVARMRAR